MPARPTAFSLIELLVALSILAVVSAIIVPRFLNVRDQASAVALNASKNEIQHAYDQWTVLGGTVTPGADTYERATAFIKLMAATGPARAAGVTEGGATARDGTGSLGSSTIGLSITVIPDPGGNYRPGAAYNSGGWMWIVDEKNYYVLQLTDAGVLDLSDTGPL